jgi:hypothetical protein
MAVVYKITGKDVADDTEYATLDEARAAIREPFLGKTGEWVEDVDAKGNFKVTFKGRGNPRSWTIKQSGSPDE